MLEQHTDFAPLNSAEIDQVSGGSVALFAAVVAVGALIYNAYNAGYQAGENDGARTCR